MDGIFDRIHYPTVGLSVLISVLLAFALIFLVMNINASKGDS